MQRPAIPPHPMMHHHYTAIPTYHHRIAIIPYHCCPRLHPTPITPHLTNALARWRKREWNRIFKTLSPAPA